MIYKKLRNIFTALTLSLGLAGCSPATTEETATPSASAEATATATTAVQDNSVEGVFHGASTFNSDGIGDYAGELVVRVNDGIPFFTDSEKQTYTAFENYSPLDSLGRVGVATACVGQELMPTEDRGSISEVAPSGWHNESYDFVDGGWVYNRCHLIGFQLTGENANVQNLMTGTRTFNVDGMLPFENMVADHVKETGGHVMYRVTPVYDGNNLVAKGVLMEGWSCEDAGASICFCNFVYNVEPGVVIDYATGQNHAATGESGTQFADPASEPDVTATYVLNTNSKKFHLPECSSISRMSAKNREDYNGSRNALIEQGYEPCGNCNP